MEDPIKAPKEQESTDRASLRTWPSWLAMIIVIPGSLMVSGVVLIVAALAMGGFELSEEAWLTSWGSLKTWVLLALACPAVQLASLLFASLFFDLDEPSEHLEMINGLLTSQSGFIGVSLVLLLAAIAPGFSEELFFRGFVRVGLERRHGFLVAILVPALMFAAVHMDPMHATAVFPLGLYFGCLTYWSRSTLPAIGAHVINNLFAIISALAFSTEEIVPPDAGTMTSTSGMEELGAITLLGYLICILFLFAGITSLRSDRSDRA
jgi:membrane protease YdiL (CAAX protease family)